ncbi:hypothetical protein D9M71_679000 [compost metagenome]
MALWRRMTMAGATVSRREISTAPPRAKAATMCSQLNGRSSSSRPIRANSRALRISSISSQNLST